MQLLYMHTRSYKFVYLFSTLIYFLATRTRLSNRQSSTYPLELESRRVIPVSYKQEPEFLPSTEILVLNLVLVIPYSPVQGLCLRRGLVGLERNKGGGTDTRTRGHAKGVGMSTHTWGTEKTTRGGGTYR